MKKIKMLTAALGLMAAAAMADSAKIYKVNLPEGKIGTAALTAGEYKLSVDGAAVKLTELKTGKVLDLTARVENLDKKTPSTEIHSAKIDGVTKINEIRPGGTKVRIDFREQTTP